MESTTKSIANKVVCISDAAVTPAPSKPVRAACRAEEYVELHAASAFSFLEGASQPEALVERAVELDMPAMGLLDRNGLYGSVRFHAHGMKKGLRALIGSEIAVQDLLGLGKMLPAAWEPHQFRPQPPRIPVLCANPTGYQNLCQLITRFKMREPGKGEGAARCEDMEEFAGGTVALTGGPEGPLAAALSRGGEAEGRQVVEWMMRAFGAENVYVELQRHGDRAEEWRNQAALRIAESLRLPVLATNGVRYARGEEREILDVFTSIQHGVSLDHAGRLLECNSQRLLRSGRSMARIFRDIPEAIANTSLLAGRLTFQMEETGYEFPSYDVGDLDTMDSFLRKACLRRS